MSLTQCQYRRVIYENIFVLTTWYSTKLPWASCYYYKKAKQKPQSKSKQTNKSQLQLWWILGISERLSRGLWGKGGPPLAKWAPSWQPGNSKQDGNRVHPLTWGPNAVLIGSSPRDLLCSVPSTSLPLFSFHTVIRGSLWVVRMHWYEIWSGTLESGRDFHL